MAQKTSTTPTKRAAPKKPAAKTSAASAPTKSAAKTPASAKSVTKNATKRDDVALEDFAPAAISNEQREEMVRYAAYHLAEKDGFQAGRESDYWFQAQEQVDQLLNGIQSPKPSATRSEQH